MKQHGVRTRWLIPLLLIVLLLASCSSDATVDENGAAAAEVAAQAAANTPTAAPGAESSEDAAAEPLSSDAVDECLTCHIDKEMLIDTAKPEEEVIVESEGEG